MSEAERSTNPPEYSGPVRVKLTGKARATLDFDFNPSDEQIADAAERAAREWKQSALQVLKQWWRR